MRIARPVIALALCASLLAVGSASAASKPSGLPKARPLSWTDPGGDANGINDQGGVSPANPSTATPVQAAGADILGVSFNRVDDGKKVKGLQVVMTLASAPMSNVLYRVTGASSNCTTFWFQYETLVGGAPVAVLRHNCTPSNSPTAVVSNTVSVPIDTVVKGSTITWTLKVSDFPSGVKIGSVLSPALGETRTIVGAATTAAATAPVIDETATQATTYKIGQ